MNILVEIECDLLVAGGGISGVCCALAAARSGAKVLLVQDRAVLGGNASSEIRMHIVGADCHGGRGIALECEAREGGLIEEIRLDLSVRNPQRAPSLLDLDLYDKCRTEPNITVLFNATVNGAEVVDGRICSVRAVRESTETAYRITARQYVDCTGDSRLGLESGADYRRGRESQAEFNESLAQPEADDRTLGSSLLFTASRHDVPMEYCAPTWARRFTADELRHRLHLRAGVEADRIEYGFWWLEWGGELDTIADNEAIRDELLAIVLGVWDHIKNSGLYPGVEYWALDWLGFLPGKRESRRLQGPYTLTEHDVNGGAAFDDAIAYGGWWLDLHPPGGVDAVDEKPCVQHHIEYLYDIPLRVCFSRNIANLWMAGRNISATHVAFASTRVMATCAVIGQGVGVAAAAAVRHDVDPATMVATPELMHEVQQRLLKEDCFLIGRRNQDERDLARRAVVTASSEIPGGEAANVIDGITRSVHGAKGVPAERTVAGTHRWISRDGAPGWISLSWDEAVMVSEVQLVFDAGMHRELTFSLSSYTNRKILWGQGQPEMVRHYRLVGVGADGSETVLAEESKNHQRLRVHRFDEPVTVSAVRLDVLATYGADARVCEIRVY